MTSLLQPSQYFKFYIASLFFLISFSMYSQDFGWRNIYSAGGNVIQYRIYVGDPRATRSHWKTMVYARSTFAETVEFSLVADVKGSDGQQSYGKPILYGVLYEGNGHLTDNLHDYIGFSNVRFERLKIGNSQIMKDFRVVGNYQPENNNSGNQNGNSHAYENADTGSGSAAFARYFEAGTGYEDSGDYESAISQYNLARENVQTAGERAEVDRRIAAATQALHHQNREAEEARLSKLREENRAYAQQQLDEINRKSQQTEDIAQQLAPLAQAFIDAEMTPLREATDLMFLGGSASWLLQPMVAPNRDAGLLTSTVGWSGEFGSLRRKGLSFFVSMEFLK